MAEILGNVYGGGNQAGASKTNVILTSGEVGDVFGGSNQSGNVNESNVIANGFEGLGGESGAKMTVTYTASPSESWQSTEYQTIATINVNIQNTSVNEISTWNAMITAENSTLFSNYSNTDIIESNGTYSFTQVNRYYGNNILAAGNGSYSFEFNILSKVEASSFTLSYYFEGQDDSGNSYKDSDSKSLNVQNIYGGNNAGGITNNPKVTISGGTIGNIFGGGNQAEVQKTDINISGGKITNIYGGGNAAAVTTNTSLIMTGGNVSNNIYGGGNEGIVQGSSVANIKDAEILGSAYGGGNGSTAIVYGDSTLTIQGDCIIGFENCDTPRQGCAFAGGNAAATGTTTNGNTSKATINVAGGIIYGNVYGGANTSVVYGKTDVNVGKENIVDSTVTIGDIYIYGTVFGGGEANASGSEIFDFDFISVTDGIDVSINGSGYNSFKIEGSIFGSGNASTTSGRSEIYIDNFGTIDIPQKNISIQRANLVVMNNSAIALSGAKDRTNEYSNEFFTISRIDEFKLKNNSTLYLNYGANLLKNFSSLVDIGGTEELSTVTIDKDTGATTRNVDNRIYMYEGRNLNIATNEKVTTYGKVNGMTFLGLYTNSMNPSTSTGFYNHSYENGDAITNAGTFSNNSYVMAEHKENHNIEVDGFYTNINNEGVIKTEYVGVTPEEDVYYMWIVGEALDVTTYEIVLTASKYATLGTTELPLTGFSNANTKFIITGFSAGLREDIKLVNQKDIPPIADSDTIADTQFGLNMKSGKSGWITTNENNFYTSDGGKYDGKSLYQTENANVTPSLTFCFFHSQNLSREQTLGAVKIRFQVLIPDGDLNYRIAYADVNITLLTDLFQDDYYEAAITPGEEFELFTTTETNITNDGEFSVYYSLYIPDFSENDLYEDYKKDKRCIVSRNLSNVDYVFKENTRITMLDLVTKTTYYYVVSAQDVTSNKNIYYLTDFIKMGSTDEKYNPNDYYDSYYVADKDLIYESYIFQVNFSESNINTDILDNTLLMELHDENDETLVGVLGIERDTTKYSVYTNKEARITVEADIVPETIYLGDTVKLDVKTNFQQEKLDTKTIYDTKYFNQKVGIKISLYDTNGNQLNSDSLLGIYFELDGKKYYPRIDGSTRINVADRLSNVLSKITIDTSQNKTLATGNYKMKIETFGSSDGIYYGLEASDYIEKEIYIINGSYGLRVTTTDGEKIVNRVTGKNKNNENLIRSVINYSSSLDTPILTVSLERRDYSSIYSTDYNQVDLSDYIANSLQKFRETNEYIITTSPMANMTSTLILKENLVTGTYKLVYKLYDDNIFIGDVYEYIIIR